MPTWRSRSWSVLTVALVGCTFVTKKDINEHFACLDEDNDGAVKQENCLDIGEDEADCDDANPDRTPSKPEIEYDGIDNDCDGLDRLDIDGDGFPGIAPEDWVAQHEGVEWPSSLSDQKDCNDNVADIFPGSAAEVPYDAVDSDCDGQDDYDFDGDGYVLRSDLLPDGAPPYIGELPGGDCDDTREDVNPGEPSLSDASYDGVDTNCDGSNDFDADGDEWMPDGFELEFQAYIEQYDYEFELNFGDCDDFEAGIFPGAEEFYYDGVDADCDDADDFDADLDGFALRDDLLPPGSAAYSGDLPQTDCDDEVPEVFPGALERIGDTVDSDCDGGQRTALFGFSAFAWNQPRPPSVGATDFHYLLTTAADTFTSGVSTTNVGITLMFDKTAVGGDEPAGNNRWESAVAGAFADQIDVIYGSDRYYVGAAHQRPVAGNTKNDARLYRFVWDAGISRYIRLFISSVGVNADPYLGLDIEFDGAGKLLLGACGQGVGHFMIARNEPNGTFVPEDSVPASLTDPVSPIENGAGGAMPAQVGLNCALEATTPDPTLHAWPTTGANDFTTNWTSVSYRGPNATWSGYKLHSVVHEGSLAVLSGTTPSGSVPAGLTVFSNGAVLGRYLLTDEVYWADAALLGGQIHIVAVVKDRANDGKDDLIMLSGPVANPTATVVPFTRPGMSIEPTAASIHADAERVFVAVTGTILSGGTGDVVGWTFFRP
jgi:hypothetical protein